MWTAIGGFVFGIPVFLCSLGWNNAFRSQAANAPGSLPYYFIRAYDAFWNRILFRYSIGPSSAPRPAEMPSTSPEAGSPFSRFNLHDFARIDEMISIRQSFTISIDMSKKMPAIWRNWIINPFFVASVMYVFGLLFSLSLMPLIVKSDLFPLEAVNVVMIIFTFMPFLIAIVPSWITHDWSGFRVFALYFRPDILIMADEKVVIVGSAFANIR